MLPSRWEFGPFRLDASAGCLWRNEELMDLPSKPVALLACLVAHADEVVSKEALLDAVWPETTVSEGVLKTYIAQIRQALGETARKPRYLVTMRGRGYRFIGPVRAEGAAVEPYATVAAETPLVRRLAAFLSADVQGYSRLMEDDDAATVQTLNACRAVMRTLIEHHHGRLVDAPGDNVLAEFASVVEAVQCAIAIQQELAQRNQVLPEQRQMWFRIGINLGDVLVDGDEVYGDGVNIAARLEGLAEGGGICISGSVYDQIETKFDLAYIDLGEQTVKNIAKPVRVYRVASMPESAETQATREPSPTWVPATSHAVPPPYLVSREVELEQLHQRLRAAQSGQRQVLFITGEAGIGKTTLVDAFVHEVIQRQEIAVSRGQCIDQYGAGEAYLPLLEALGALGQSEAGDRVVDVLRHQAPTWLAHLPALVAPHEYERLDRLKDTVPRERMLRELTDAIERVTAENPLILILEDLHWSDVSTIDWLAYVARRRTPACLLILGTYRPADAIVQQHPLNPIAHELQRQGFSEEFMLEYLSEAGVMAYLSQRLGESVSTEEMAQFLHQHTSGNPFFLGAIVDELIRQDRLIQAQDGWRLRASLPTVTADIPESIHHLIEYQLDHLSETDRELLAAASVAGKEFTTALVESCVESDAEILESQFTRWAQQGQFVRAGGVDQWHDGTVSARFAFIHDLYRRVIYMQIPVSRQIRWHREIGMRLEAAYGAQGPHLAAELATHFMEGRVFLQALHYFRLAGKNALLRSAHQEAMTSFERALDAAAQLPRDPTTLAMAIDLRFDMRHAFLLRGENQRLLTYLQEAEAFAQRLEDRLRLAQALAYQCCHFYVVGEHERSIDAGERVLALSQTSPDFPLQVEINFWLGQVYHATGAYGQAIAHLQQNVDALTGSQAYDFYGLAGVASVFSRAWLGLCQLETGDFHPGLELLEQGPLYATKNI